MCDHVEYYNKIVFVWCSCIVGCSSPCQCWFVCVWCVCRSSSQLLRSIYVFATLNTAAPTWNITHAPQVIHWHLLQWSWRPCHDGPGYLICFVICRFSIFIERFSEGGLEIDVQPVRALLLRPSVRFWPVHGMFVDNKFTPSVSSHVPFVVVSNIFCLRTLRVSTTSTCE